MKLFVSLKLTYAKWGIRPIETGSKHSFNFTNCLALLLVIQFCMTATIYLIRNANSVPEYADSFYTFSTSGLNVLNILLIVLKSANIHQLIENIEKVIEQRNQLANYDALNQKIEQFSKRFYFIYVYCTLVGVMLPNIFKSYFLYFTTDSGNDAFQLPFLST